MSVGFRIFRVLGISLALVWFMEYASLGFILADYQWPWHTYQWSTGARALVLLVTLGMNAVAGMVACGIVGDQIDEEQRRELRRNATASRNHSI